MFFAVVGLTLTLSLSVLASPGDTALAWEAQQFKEHGEQLERPSCGMFCIPLVCIFDWKIMSQSLNFATSALSSLLELFSHQVVWADQSNLVTLLSKSCCQIDGYSGCSHAADGVVDGDNPAVGQRFSFWISVNMEPTGLLQRLKQVIFIKGLEEVLLSSGAHQLEDPVRIFLTSCHEDSVLRGNAENALNVAYSLLKIVHRQDGDDRVSALDGTHSLLNSVN